MLDTNYLRNTFNVKLFLETEISYAILIFKAVLINTKLIAFVLQRDLKLTNKENSYLHKDRATLSFRNIKT